MNVIMNNPRPAYRRATMADLPAMQQLFVDSILRTCNNDYEEGQLLAWVSGVEDTRRWESIINSQYVMVCEVDTTLQGFCTLKDGTYLDMLFVSPTAQRGGIARALYLHIELESRRAGAKEITVDASITARRFFEKMGFTILREQLVERKGVHIKNYKMCKPFGDDTAAGRR